MNTKIKETFIIGLTGNIGTGKTTVMQMLQQRGAMTIDADDVAHELMTPGRPVYAAVVEAFGRSILKPDGTVDRSKLGQLVFTDPQRLAQLERIVHPAVIEEIIRRAEATDAAVVVIEAIKLLEAGIASTLCDQIWVVTSSLEQQIDRLMRTRGMSRAQAEARMRVQSPEAFKVSQADVVIDNSRDIASVEAQIDAAWAKLNIQTPA